MSTYQELYQQSINDPEAFWGEAASHPKPQNPGLFMNVFMEEMMMDFAREMME